jgi:thiol peroxidase
MDDTVVVCVSADLPFAMGRFCGAEGIENVTTASTFRSSFGDDYGVKMAEGRLAALMARAVVVIDEAGKVIYTHVTDSVGDEPNYEAAIAALG